MLQSGISYAEYNALCMCTYRTELLLRAQYSTGQSKMFEKRIQHNCNAITRGTLYLNHLYNIFKYFT
jgi:hypothetical protein